MTSLFGLRAGLVLLLGCGPSLGVTVPAFAQTSVTSASDGTGTAVTFDAASQIYTINGGTQVDANLFHSFQQFGLNANEIANFLANPDVANILARVSGGHASVIDGLLQVSGGNNANLFILNPAGVLLGRNANLNLAGSFSVSTASGLVFGDNVFNASGSNDYSALTGNPTGYVFLGHEGVLLNEADLSVNAGESLTLAGGTVINTGNLDAPEGNVSIVAMPEEGILRISQDGLVMSLAVPTDALNNLIDSGITPLDLPSLLAGEWGGDATTVSTQADGTVVLSTGGAVNAEPGAVISTGTVDVSGVQGGRVVFIGEDIALPAGLIDISGTAAGGDLAVYARDDLRLGVSVDAVGGGQALFDPATLNIDGAAANTIVTTLAGGNAIVEATETINVNAVIDSSAQANNNTLTFRDENADNTLTINLNAGIELGANQTLTGEGTTVNVNTTTAGIVQNGVDVAAADATVNLGEGIYQEGQPVTINRALTLNGAGAGSTILDSQGNHRVLEIANGVTGNVNINQLTISNGSTTGNGGGILNNAAGATLSLSNATVSGNSAGDRGGGIYTLGAVTLSNATVSGNSSTGNGGGIYARNGAIAMTNSTVSGNSSNQYGGGIYTRSVITVTNSTVSGNSSRRNGGGLYSRSGAITVTNSTVSGNSSNRHGGGIWSRNRSITLTDSTVSGNSARVSVGGAYSSHITVTNSTVSGNSAGDLGGGLYATGSLTITNSTVSGNSATNKGGGAYHRNHATITNSTISGNSSNRGGGMYARGGGDVTVINSTVSGNSANDRGGGIFMRNRNGGDLILSNATVGFNTANVDGGGIFVNTTRNNIINNSIVANNNAGRSGPDISANLNSSTITNSLIQDTTGITAGAPTNGVDGNIIGQDPLLAPLVNNGGPTQTHALLAGSPAINGSGVGATPNDQRGVAAIDTRDIGAFEFVAVADQSTLDPDILFNRLAPLTVGEGPGRPILRLSTELAAELGLLELLNDDGTLTPAGEEDATNRPATTQPTANDPEGGTDNLCFNGADPNLGDCVQSTP
ncbi:MAG: filamentous hemagglutinin N-terminal domain-containing protein [Cyanobacteria bacterium P01_A01_bin.123]